TVFVNFALFLIVLTGNDSSIKPRRRPIIVVSCFVKLKTRIFTIYGIIEKADMHGLSEVT
ncbi:hypothetical protein QW71_33275, partial [Paenibacillus sp. IHB B 3415]